MRALMGYGRQDGKPSSHVERSAGAADGFVYGIVRENSKYVIKAARPKKEGELVAEDYEYIGGFRNHKAYEYDNYQQASKQLDLKLMSIQEAYAPQQRAVEAPKPMPEDMDALTESMRAEIARQREIVRHAAAIMKEDIGAGNTGVPEAPETAGKKGGLSDPFKEPAKATLDKDLKKTASDPKKQGEPFDKDGGVSDSDLESDKKKQGGGDEDQPFGEWPKHAPKNNVATSKPKGGKAVKVNESETLAVNKNDDYLDKGKGTNIGDSAPFTDCPGSERKVEEGVAAWQEGDNQNRPEPGTGEVGDDAPFDQKVCERKGEGKCPRCGKDDCVCESDDADEYAGFEDDDDNMELDDNDNLELDDDFEWEDGSEFSDEEARDFEDEFGVNPLALSDQPEDMGEADDTVEPAAEPGAEAGKKPEDPNKKQASLSSKGWKKYYADENLSPEVVTAVQKVEEVDRKARPYDKDTWNDPQAMRGLLDQLAMANWRLRKAGLLSFDPEAKTYPELAEKIAMTQDRIWDRIEALENWEKDPEPATADDFDPMEGKRKSGKPRMNEETTKLDDFGKHPAYRKKPMTTPPNADSEKDGYKDWNDDSAKGEEPFGKKIGSSAPFDEAVRLLADAVVRQVMENIKKKRP